MWISTEWSLFKGDDTHASRSLQDKGLEMGTGCKFSSYQELGQHLKAVWQTGQGPPLARQTGISVLLDSLCPVRPVQAVQFHITASLWVCASLFIPRLLEVLHSCRKAEVSGAEQGTSVSCQRAVLRNEDSGPGDSDARRPSLTFRDSRRGSRHPQLRAPRFTGNLVALWTGALREL